jgi:hypothetical protein
MAIKRFLLKTQTTIIRLTASLFVKEETPSQMSLGTVIIKLF